jgi:hypothetical protein
MGSGWRLVTAAQEPCSDQSLRRDDPMYGTASAGFAWLMVEMPGAWGHSAFLDSPANVDRELGRAIARRAESAGMRIAAIRRHGKRSTNPRWRWFIAHSRVGEEALFHGEVDNPREYLDVSLDGADGDASSEPLVAVCAHGKHDQCCAVRGRAATAAIASEYPEWTWECSHLGGDRFAATMLILPHGLCYGRVDSTDSADLVRLYSEGRLNNTFLRGRTSLPHAVQAAQYFVRHETGNDRIDALHPVSVEHSEHRIRVVLRDEQRDVEVVLSERLSEPLVSSCHANIAGRVRTFALESIL